MRNVFHPLFAFNKRGKKCPVRTHKNDVFKVSFPAIECCGWTGSRGIDNLGRLIDGNVV